jgi:hypothetical protein
MSKQAILAFVTRFFIAVASGQQETRFGIETCHTLTGNRAI